jgi:hypothetical protein
MVTISQAQMFYPEVKDRISPRSFHARRLQYLPSLPTFWGPLIAYFCTERKLMNSTHGLSVFVYLRCDMFRPYLTIISDQFNTSSRWQVLDNGWIKQKYVWSYNKCYNYYRVYLWLVLLLLLSKCFTFVGRFVRMPTTNLLLADSFTIFMFYFYQYMVVFLFNIVIYVFSLFSYPDWGFSVLFPQLQGKCQSITRQDGARPALFQNFCVVLCIFLCCSVYCLCVNVYCTTATGWQPNCS